MATKAAIASRLAARRGLSESEAAVYVGISPSNFRDLVERKIMPAPKLLGSRLIWDIVELDLAFNELPSRREKDNDSWADYR
jgi:predicted DNA-binding transcriptional regulator AlpA